MSNFYLDVVKDRLYCEDKQGVLRRSAQTAMYEILDALVRMIAPILCFTADEIWQAMPHRDGDDPANIVLNQMPKVQEAWAFAAEDADKWEKLIGLRDDVNKALEEARKNKVIGKPLEAWVTVYAEGEVAALLERVPADELAALCIVSKLRMVRGAGEGMQGENLPEIRVAIERASGEKCERCWMYVDSIGQDSKHPTLCARCASVVG